MLMADEAFEWDPIQYEEYKWTKELDIMHVWL